MKVTNILIIIVLVGAFVSIFTLFLQQGVNEYNLEVDPELQTTLDELNNASGNTDIEEITSALNSTQGISSDAVGEVLQFKRATGLVTTVQSIKPISNTMFSSIAEYLEIPPFMKSTFGILISIGLLSFGVYLILGRKP